MSATTFLPKSVRSKMSSSECVRASARPTDCMCPLSPTRKTPNCSANATTRAVMATFTASKRQLAEITINEPEYFTTSLHFKMRFSADHRLHVPSFSDAKNAELFGKCDNPRGHGHLYRVEATIGGNYDQRTGILYDFTAFQNALQRGPPTACALFLRREKRRTVRQMRQPARSWPPLPRRSDNWRKLRSTNRNTLRLHCISKCASGLGRALAGSTSRSRNQI